MGVVSLESEGIARWDEYRRNYDDMAYGDVVDMHDWVWDNYPDQSHYSEGPMDAFFTANAKPGDVVVEVGGWRGEAAARILAAHPEISAWENYEICRGAVANPVTEDDRYHPIHPRPWVWRTMAPIADLAILAHVIEHVSDKQVGSLLSWVDRCGVRAAYIEAPLLEQGQGWMGGNTAHVLTYGWDRVRNILHDLGFRTTAPRHAKKDYFHITAAR